jgi:hypothetical protein
MENLCEIGFHPRPLACRKDDRGEPSGFSLLPIFIIVHASQPQQIFPSFRNRRTLCDLLPRTVDRQNCNKTYQIPQGKDKRFIVVPDQLSHGLLSDRRQVLREEGTGP